MKAVIPAAGLGTRFLPLTKEQPKEMLPVVDRPAIHWVVEDAIAAGATDILIITGRGKRVILDYIDRSLHRNHYLTGNRNERPLVEVEELASQAYFHFSRQREPCGLDDAMLQAGSHLGPPQCVRFHGGYAKPDSGADIAYFPSRRSRTSPAGLGLDVQALSSAVW